MIFSSAHLAFVCVGCVERKKSTTFEKLIMHTSSTSWQSQIMLLSLAENYEHYFSFELS
jgi:hypothetical protein